MGLRRDHSGESSLSRRRMSIETADTESNSNLLEKANTASSDDVGKSWRHNFVNEAIPESPSLAHEDQPTVFTGTGTEPNKRQLGSKSKPDSSSSFLNEQDGTEIIGKEAKRSQLPQNEGCSSTKRKVIGDRSITRPESKTTNRGPLASKSSVQKLQKSSGGMPSSTKTRSSKMQFANSKADNETTFVKPKPKSPTKPVHLPSSLIAPTASSVSKVHGRQPLSHDIETQKNLTRATNETSTTKSRALQTSVTRPGSTTSRSRPSLGPPPTKQHQPTSNQQRQSNVDERFLARMMRPTQSSSSKATDKALCTPPKKTAQRSGPHLTQPLPRSGSSKGHHSKGTSGPVSSKPASRQQISPAEKQGSIKSEDHSLIIPAQIIHSNSASHNDLSRGLPDDESTFDPSAEDLRIKQDSLPVPQEQNKLEATAEGQSDESRLTMNHDIVRLDRVGGEVADSGVCHNAAGMTTLTVNCPEGDSKNCSIDETKEPSEGRLANEQPNGGAERVEYTEETPKDADQVSPKEEKFATAANLQNNALVEMDYAKSLDVQARKSQLNLRDPEEQSAQEEMESDLIHCEPEDAAASLPQNSQFETVVGNFDIADLVESATHDPVGTAQAAVETEESKTLENEPQQVEAHEFTP